MDKVKLTSISQNRGLSVEDSSDTKSIKVEMELLNMNYDKTIIGVFAKEDMKKLGSSLLNACVSPIELPYGVWREISLELAEEPSASDIDSFIRDNSRELGTEVAKWMAKTSGSMEILSDIMYKGRPFVALKNLAIANGKDFLSSVASDSIGTFMYGWTQSSDSAFKFFDEASLKAFTKSVGLIGYSVKEV